MRRPVIVAAAVAALSFSLSANAGPQGFTILGRWEGTLHQRGLAPFTVTARVRGFDALSRNTVHYSGINCSGHWTFLFRAGFAYHFREVITSRKNRTCKSLGRVTLTRVDTNRVRYRFQGGGVVSRGVLRRP